MSKHLTERQRYLIFELKQEEYQQKDIARVVGVSCSTISRELRRNCDLRSGKYVMDLAQRKAEERKRNKRRKQVFTDTMKDKCRELLELDFSPEQIMGRCKLKGFDMVSHVRGAGSAR